MLSLFQYSVIQMFLITKYKTDFYRYKEKEREREREREREKELLPINNILQKKNPHLGEVAHNVGPILVVECEDVEEEGLHIIVECFVVKEQLGQQTQVLTVQLTGIAIHLKHRQLLVAVDFISWGVQHAALILQSKHFKLSTSSMGTVSQKIGKNK